MRLPPGRARLATKPAPIGSETVTNTIGIVRLSRCNAAVTGGRMCEDHVGLQGDQLLREHLNLIGAAGRKAIVDADIAALRPSEPFEPLPESREPRLRFRIVLGEGPSARRCAASARPAARAPRAATPRRRAAEQRDELAPSPSLVISPRRRRPAARRHGQGRAPSRS